MEMTILLDKYQIFLWGTIYKRENFLTEAYIKMIKFWFKNWC